MTRRVISRVCAAVFLFAGMSIAPRAVTPADAAFPARNGPVILSIHRQGPLVNNPQNAGADVDIFAVSLSGALTQLTTGPETDFDPATSPEGGRVAFSRSVQTPREFDIYVIDIAGGAVTNLTTTPLDSEYTPSWSPDGTEIAFTREEGNPGNYASPVPGLAQADVYIMPAHGGNAVRLTDSPSMEWAPAWSPRGDVIAYVEGFGSRAAIRLVRRDGTSEGVVLPPGKGFAVRGVSWSPDGRRLTFGSVTETRTAAQPTTGNIWVVNRDGSELTNLTSEIQGVQIMPAWSPDGKWIAFLSNHNNDRYTVYKMRVDGGKLTKMVDLTVDAELLSEIDWGPRP